MHIRVNGLTKSYHNNLVVDHVSFEIAQGKLVGLLGPSGGGKTTILRILAGLEQPTSGEIYVHDMCINSLTPQERKIGFVFQNYALFRHMSVFENIAFGLKVQKQSKRTIELRVQELLELTGLKGFEKRLPHQLSGGQRQRVAFARAIAPRPDILFLDEPFSAIDVKIRKELRRWLREMIDQLNITTIFVTHDQDEAIEITDEILVINQGKVEQMGTPWEIYTHPKTSFVAGFIGDSTVLEGLTPIPGFERSIHHLLNTEHDIQNAKMMIRPEYVEVGYEFELSERKDSAKGTVQQVRFRGTHFEVEVKVGHQQILAHRSLDKPVLQVGEGVFVRIHRLYVFHQSKNWMFENEIENNDPIHIVV
jgi:sulfate/thiosulfate transport system ATP-binding protein